MQMYENVRSTFIRLLQADDSLNPIDIDAVELNSARTLAALD